VKVKAGLSYKSGYVQLISNSNVPVSSMFRLSAITSLHCCRNTAFHHH